MSLHDTSLVVIPVSLFLLLVLLPRLRFRNLLIVDCLHELKPQSLLRVEQVHDLVGLGEWVKSCQDGAGGEVLIKVYTLVDF